MPAIGASKVAQLRADIKYDPESGEFTWRTTRSRTTAGSPAGCVDDTGYRRIKHCGRVYRAQQLAIILMLGRMPNGHAKLRNGDLLDTRWENIYETGAPKP